MLELLLRLTNLVKVNSLLCPPFIGNGILSVTNIRLESTGNVVSSPSLKLPEEAVNFVRVTAEGDGCTVGFLPRIWLKLPKVQQNLNEFCIVTELYADSENQCKAIKSNRNVGMAGVILLSFIPINE